MFKKVRENPEKFKPNLICNFSAHPSHPDRKDLQIPAISTAQGTHPSAELFSHTINTKQAQLPQAYLHKSKADINIITPNISPLSQQKNPKVKVKVRPKLTPITSFFKPITTTKPSYKLRQQQEESVDCWFALY